MSSPPDLDPSQREFLASLADGPVARQPATIGETWNAEWTRAGLDVLAGGWFGSGGKPYTDARADLINAIEGAAGQSLGDYARQKGVQLGGPIDAQITALSQLVDTLPEDDRKA